MRNQNYTLFFASILLFNICSLVWGAEATAPDPMVLEQERRLKEDTETKSQAICDSIFGRGLSSVLTNVELGLESVKKGGAAMNRKMDSKNGLADDNFILPWVPAPKSVTKEEVPKDANVETQAAQQETVDVKTVLKRFDITVVHDESIPAERVTMAKDTLTSTFERYKGVLKLFFRPTKFVRDQGVDPRQVVTKNFLDSLNLKTILLLLLLISGALAIFQVLKFLFGPLAEFMRSYIEGMREQSKSKVEMENKSETENDTEGNQDGENLEGEEGQLTAEELAAQEEEEAQMKKFVPFSYINDENVKQLVFLLRHEEPWIVAMVLSYLSSEHALKVLQALPASLQAKVALETAMFRQTSLEQVMAIDQDIKEKIDFVVGGLEKLVGILESSDRFARDNILEYLKNEKPGLYEKVRERILLFEDIVKFPKMVMQTVVRELKTESLAKALREASPELQQKFFENMSQGAVTLLKEEMEYGPPVTPDQIEEERRIIVDFIKKQEADGKISFRQKGNVNALSGEEIGTDLASMKLENIMDNSAGQDPEKALEAYNAGVAAAEQGDTATALEQFKLSVQLDPTNLAARQNLANTYYGSGQFEDALREFEAVLQMEPNEELKTWVEQLRASLSTPTS